MIIDSSEPLPATVAAGSVSLGNTFRLSGKDYLCVNQGTLAPGNTGAFNLQDNVMEYIPTTTAVTPTVAHVQVTVA